MTTKGKPRPSGKRISEAEFQRLWADLDLSVEEIGRRLGISQQGVTHRARTRGLPHRPKRGAKPACEPAALVRLYAAGLSMPDIALALGCNRKTVHNYCVRLGLPRRGNGTRPTITLADYRAQLLRAAMAADAEKCRVQFQAAEMVDHFQAGRWPARRAA